MASKNVIEIKDDDFSKVLSEAKVPFLVDFWADWCGPCKMIAPVVEEIAAQYEGKILVGKMNVDTNTVVPVRYQVISIPTIIIFKDGEEVDRSIGYKTKEELNKFLNDNL